MAEPITLHSDVVAMRRPELESILQAVVDMQAVAAHAAAALIQRLDIEDGDPDLENATDLEDDFSLSAIAVAMSPGPGCQSSDTGEAAYVEWHTKPTSRLGSTELTAGQEDDEDDDPAEDDDPDHEHDGREPDC